MLNKDHSKFAWKLSNCNHKDLYPLSKELILYETNKSDLMFFTQWFTQTVSLNYSYMQCTRMILQ